MKKNSYLEIKNYFENVVMQSSFLNDFVGFFEREWASKKSSVKGLKSPILALFRYNLGFEGQNENAIAVRKIGFAIMFNKIKPGDLEAQYQAIADAEEMAIKILARMRYEAADTSHFLYNAFLKNSVEIKPVELSAGDFGVDVLFSLKNNQPLKVDFSDWKDLEPCD
ncbi:MAG: hypothetical protein KBS61_05740 [Chryseobacterium sp.]|nr:hypothetical protein [Candidatus Chryseobacterium enterohippi]